MEPPHVVSGGVFRPLFSLGLGAALLTGCADRPPASGAFEDQLATAVTASGQSAKPLKLADVTDFAWDRLYVFPPYTPTAAIQRDLGFAWPEADRTGIDERDGVTLLVFVANRHVVRSVEYPRNRGDFAMIDHHAGFTPERAVFRVSREDADPAWWIVTEAQSPH
jgi:hypothetical protein